MTETTARADDYADQFAAELTEQHEQRVKAIGGGIPTMTIDLIHALAQGMTGEVFIEIDRGVLADAERQADGRLLLAYLYPVAVRYDDDDIIIHVTDGDTAQFGRIAKEPTDAEA